MHEHDEVAARIEVAEREAASGCGLSDVLYEARVQAAYAAILAQTPDAHRGATESTLKARGFEPAFMPHLAEADECSLTGIPVEACSCGRHP